MITKTYVKSRKAWRVDFEVPAAELPEGQVVETLHVVGSFNNWDEEATPMAYNARRRAWKARLYLPPGQEVHFRYLLNGEQWCNDWHAEAYAPGGFGEDNCVVYLPEEGNA